MLPIESSGTHKENDMSERYVSVEDGDVTNVAENLAGYLVHVLKKEDVLRGSFRNTERNLEEWFTLCLGDEEFREIFLAAAVWILKQRKDDDRLYYLDGKGMIDYHILVRETPIREVSGWDTSMCTLDFDKMRRHAEFTEGNDSNSNDEGSE